jgi:Zn-dependent protease/predicted transcriptional regulator
MFERRIPLFKLFGFKVGIDLTWLILAVLVTWSLAKGVFPNYFKGLSDATYWWMGVAGALGLFFSIVFHEFCHSLVARRFNLQMKGITLFIFGGVAEMEEEPNTPKSEFFMAVVGPISSLVLAVVLFLIQKVGNALGLYKPVTSVILYLGWLNVILAVFNMVPAFPLDGGRVLRSILWAIKGNLRWATYVASQMGSAFGWFLIILGVINFIGGNFIGGLWYLLIGMFIRSASQMSYQQMLIRRALAGESVRRFMRENPVTVPSNVSVAALVEDYFYKYHYKMFPVLDDDKLVGCVSTKQVHQLARQQWPESRVSQIAESCSNTNTISPNTDAMSALSLMNQTNNSRLLVVEGGRLLGILTLKDMLKFLSLKIDLEGDRNL